MTKTIKNKGGRPSIVLTEEQIKQIEVLALDMTVEQIADYFSISEKTFHEIKKRQPEVFTAYKKGRANGIKEVTGLLWTNMRAGDTTSILFYLKTQAGWSTENKACKKLKLSFKAKAPEAIINSSLVALEEGEINLSEANQLANLATTKMNIENNYSVEEKIIHERKSKEELWERVKLYTIAEQKLMKEKEALEKAKKI
jgi:aspartate carbamoyltransferase regulatory subunit